jgi:antitoxin ParD1/3/4
MNVSLTPELEAFVEQAVQSGRYASASEAVREGLRLLEEREAKFLALKRDIEVGLNSGEGRVFSRQMLEELIGEERAKLIGRHAAE